MELIQKYVVTSPENNIVLDNIPQTYKHLLLQQVMKTPTTTTSVYHSMLINNDSSASYGRQQMYAYGENNTEGAFVNTRPTSADSLLNGVGIDDTHYALEETYFFNYSSSSYKKNILSFGGGTGNGSLAGNNSAQVFYFCNFWDNTNAITSIKNYTLGGSYNYDVGTTFLLWGME